LQQQQQIKTYNIVHEGLDLKSQELIQKIKKSYEPSSKLYGESNVVCLSQTRLITGGR